MKEQTLDLIAKKFGTDKSSAFHDYCWKYESYFPFKREDTLRILEIGVLDGKSLKTWEEWYYNSKIFGIDINSDCKRFSENRVTVEIGSQIDETFLTNLMNTHGPFDLIIDDGSHFNYDVVFSFEKLWSSVAPGGIYVVEDACTSYWDYYGGGYKNEKSIIEYFKNVVDDINFRGIDSSSEIKNARRDKYLIDDYKKQFPSAIIDIESITFLNSIIIIKKKTNV